MRRRRRIAGMLCLYVGAFVAAVSCGETSVEETAGQVGASSTNAAGVATSADSGGPSAGSGSVVGPDADETSVFSAAPPPVPAARPGLGKRLLWYVPNRLVDLFDIFRLRLRVGPGLAANVRMTDYGAFYIGRYHSVYAGLPGPRYPERVRWPVGLEQLNGMVLMGVDATDDTPHGPRYSPTEVDTGVHLLLLGVESGVDPVELADFLGGFFLFDPRDDDYPRPRRELPPRSSALAIGPGRGALRVAEKPAAFDRWSDRLDYLYTNVPRRVDTPLRAGDRWFAEDGERTEEAPETRMRLSLYTEIVEDGGLDVSFEPDISIDVEMPNLEHRLRLFIETARADDLPGRRRTEQEDRGLTVGVGRWLDGLNLSADAGVRTRWMPEVYGRLSWRPRWGAGAWRFLPEQRVFWESDDGFGTLSKFGIYRWLGEEQRFFLRTRTAGRWTETTEGVEWEQTFGLGRISSLVDEQARGGNNNFEDLANGYGVSYSVFGNKGGVTQHRLTFGYRWPLYQRWLFWDLRPGLEWKEEHDFDIGYRLTLGVDMLFWGSGYE